MKAWLAGLISLAVALVVAIVLFAMPVGQALLAGTEGAAFGFFPILWIVINAIWVYNLTVASGHFDVLRRSFEKVSPDQRIQAIIIAFCFGALLEALAGFGTPVAITVVMLMALGFEPIKAAAVALIANTAPVAFGALATPIVTLADGRLRRQRRPRLTVDTLGAMVGRQTPILAVVVPLVLVFVVDGKRGVAPDLAARARLRRRVRRRPVRRVQLHLGAAGRHRRRAGRRRRRRAAAAGLAARPTSSPPRRPCRGAGRGRARSGAGHRRRRRRPAGTGAAADRSSTAAPRWRRPTRRTLVIIAIFSIANIPAVKEFLAEEPWTYAFDWPGLDVLNAAGDAVSTTTYTFNWLPAAGTLMIFAGLITALILKVSPGARRSDLRRTYVELRRRSSR